MYYLETCCIQPGRQEYCIVIYILFHQINEFATQIITKLANTRCDIDTLH